MENARLAYELAVKQLSSQKEDLRNLRNQASFAAATSGLVANVFVQIAPIDVFSRRAGDIPLLGIDIRLWFAIIFFGASIALAVLVVTKWEACNFELNPNWILEQASSNQPRAAIYATLAKDADRYFDENENVLDNAKSNLWWSLVFSFLQIVAWTIILSR